MTAINDLTLHQQHQQWFQEHAAWLADVSTWRQEQAAAESELLAALQLIRQHDVDLLNHARAVRDQDLIALGHEHQLADRDKFQMGSPDERETASYDRDAARQAKLSSAHVHLRKHHHALMVRIAQALKSLSDVT